MLELVKLLAEEDDYEQNFLNESEESRLPLYIYGNGEVAHRVAHKLKKQGIILDGCILDDAFCRNSLGALSLCQK